MIVTRIPQQILVQISEDIADQLIPSHDGVKGCVTSFATNLRWYCEWIADQAPAARVLVPQRLRESLGESAPLFAGLEVAWYRRNDRINIRQAERRGRTWIINASQLPMIDWDRASSESRRSGTEVTAFEAAEWGSASRYEERVLVGAGQEILRFERYYGDSPLCADLWSGESAFIVTSQEHGQAVVIHLLQRGWGLESLGAITRRFSLRWSPTPCAHSAIHASGEFAGDLGPNHTATSTMVDGVSAGDTRVQHQGIRPTLVAEGVSPAPQTPADADELVGDDHTYLWLKRAVDVTGSALGLLILSPLMLMLTLLVKVTSRGPVFFAHKRQGLGGREFPCLKFRSMTIGADEMQSALRSQNEVDGPQFRIAEDPRLTAIGHWLRRYNLDELPQLFNVFVGQMSFVGPRPSPDGENQLCPAWRRSRLSVKPGITGLWQVLRRRQCPRSDFQEWIYYDVEYARHRSLWLDWQILIHTPVAIFTPKRLDRFAARLERAGICKGSDWLPPRGQ